jgi:hypothetical protein
VEAVTVAVFLRGRVSGIGVLDPPAREDIPFRPSEVEYRKAKSYRDLEGVTSLSASSAGTWSRRICVWSSAELRLEAVPQF